MKETGNIFPKAPVMQHLSALTLLLTAILSALACDFLTPIDPTPVLTATSISSAEPTVPVPTPTAIKPFTVVSPTPKPGPVKVKLNRYTPTLAERYIAINTQHLIFPVPESITNVAPYLPNDSAGRSISKWTHMPLFLYSPDGTLVEGIATGYQLSEDGLEYTVFLHPDAVFARTGDPITSAAVKSAWEFSARQPDAQIFLEHASLIEGMDLVTSKQTLEATGLSVVDESTLKIKLARPRAVWPLEMGLWLMGIFDSKQAMTDPNWEENPNGVGPFIQTLEENLVVTPSTHFWWDVKSKLQSIEMPVISNPQVLLSMYEEGQADIIDVNLISYPSVYRLGNQSNNNIRFIGTGDISLFSFNTSLKPFDDPLVRASLSHSIDMQNIVKEITGEETKWAKGLTTGDLPCQTSTGAYKSNLVLANNLLSHSSYGSPENLPPITITVRDPLMASIGEKIVAQWRNNLGIEATLVRAEPNGKSGPNNGLVDISLVTHFADPIDVISRLAHTDVAPQMEEISSMNLHDPVRCSKIKMVGQTILDNYYHIPVIVNSDLGYLVKPWVHNFETTFGRHWLNLPWMELSARLTE